MAEQMGYGDFDRLAFERPAAGVLRVLIDTERFPMCDERMHRELGDVWSVVDADATVRAVLVEGNGADFSGPGTPEMVGSLGADHDTRVRVMAEARRIVYGVVRCTKPVVAVLHGQVMGAGLGVGLLADVSIAARQAVLVDAHVQIGVVPGDHALLCWPALCGLAKAKYHLLTGEPVTGEEAERIGLVALAVDDADARGRGLDVAQRLAAGSAVAISQTKQLLNAWYEQAGPTFETSVALEFMGFAGPDFHEALAAFAAQRPPRFA
ncbi:MAG TPA: enoyl-CoA hydratase/isomerase family protein [Acidimicrobiales bacterium]|nr:enoyl-CoA hydratase/isomerase family protein [Acidimicrobiales bacterium]